MRPEDLDHGRLLDFDAEAGVVRFVGQRALLVDVFALGLLREYLVESLGTTAARTVFTQFGFAHGWRTADALTTAFDWPSAEEWSHAGARVFALQGLFRLEPPADGLRSGHGLLVSSSYEAEQHLEHFGRSDAAVCWTISGLISGYISRASGTEIYVLEDRCVARGDPACRLFGRTRAQWGEERSEELAYFDDRRLEECLQVSLQRVVASLKTSEQTLRKRRQALERVAPEVEEPLGLIAKSSAMRELLTLTKRVAQVDSTVLISGESGSGKERIAHLLHDDSARSAGPFLAINCGAIPETLLEAELFGHARGAFTGATGDRPGLFESASGGTLLLDEIGEVSPGMQVKLLRVLQEREVRRIGENRTRKFDVRVIAATNRDLSVLVSEGAFRSDLYYRLKVVELQVPPLRNRRDDVLLLARVLLADSALRMKRKVSGLAPEVADQLLRYTWPGNVRELQNAMERAVALARGPRVELADLPEEIRDGPTLAAPTRGAVKTLADVERDYIISALELNGGNQTHTAEQLRIGSATLYRKLKSYGLLGKDGIASRRVR